MQTIDYVKKYQKDLADNKNNEKFNVWAFLFSSLYFLYVRMYFYCCVFLFVPTIICSILQYSKLSLGIILLSHLIAGFIANPMVNKYKREYIEKYKDVDPVKKVEYASISVVKIFICTILSFGLYLLYWFFKHWNKYQETTHDQVYPLACAWFNTFTAPSLFAKIGYSINIKRKLKILGFVYFVCSLVLVISMRLSQDAVDIIFWDFVWLGAFGIVIALVLYVQYKINKYNENAKLINNENVLNLSEVIIVILGFILAWAQIILGEEEVYLNNNNQYLSEYTVEQQRKIGISVGFIYRHTKGYSEVCANEGYLVNQYPNDFLRYFSEDIEELKKSLSQYNYSIQDIENNIIDAEFKTKVNTSVYEELNNLRKFIIMMQIAEENNIPLEQMKWDDSWNDFLAIKDICEIFDKNGINMLKEGENKDLLKVNRI